MTEFTKYMHLERLGTSEVEGIEIGTTYVFPKLDGTNASVWLGKLGTIKAGSRNRELELDADNAGFYNAIIKDQAILLYLKLNPHHVLYGEWLVPHTIKTYRDDAWRKFYIFDVFDTVANRFLPYTEYVDELLAFDLNVVAPLAIIKNGKTEQYQECLKRNNFYLKDNSGLGEGVVIKNYGFVNKYGRTVWAKLINQEFKEQHHLAMGAPVIDTDFVEEKIVNKYVTQSLVDKVHAKLLLDSDGWHSKMIPQLLQTVWYDLIREETWSFIKEHKNPKLDFGFMQKLTFAKAKELRKDIF